MSDSNQMIFQRFGSSYHLHIRNTDDLKCVLELGEALWVATGAPTDSMTCDPVFLDLLDTDDNKRIMCFELKNAIKWLLDSLVDYSGINKASTAVALDAINAETEDGKKIIQGKQGPVNHRARHWTLALQANAITSNAVHKQSGLA